MHVTFNELVTRHLDSRDDIFTKIVVYPLAIPLTWCLLNFTTVTANAVTMTGLALGITGCLASIVTQQGWYLFVGFFSFYICDFVDGQVASVHGGSPLGAVLDLVVDRSVLFLSVFCLALRHFTADQPYELLLLICYLCVFTYLDAIFLAKYSAARKYEASSNQNRESPGRYRRDDSIFVWALFPTRLSSPLIFIAVLALTRSFATAYYFAICCVLSEYIALTLRVFRRIGG